MIIVSDIEQGSYEWLMARVGVMTASEFDKLLTPKTMKPSAQQDDYLMALAEEWVHQQPNVMDPVGWMSHGKAYEPEARKWYEFNQDVEVTEVGIIYRDEDRDVACSPDGLIYDGDTLLRGLEIKCPSPQVHARYLLGGGVPIEYRHQVQGCLLVTGLGEWDFVSYNSRFRTQLLVRQERDELFIMELEEQLRACADKLLYFKRKLLAMEGEDVAPAHSEA